MNSNQYHGKSSNIEIDDQLENLPIFKPIKKKTIVKKRSVPRPFIGQFNEDKVMFEGQLYKYSPGISQDFIPRWG